MSQFAPPKVFHELIEVLRVGSAGVRDRQNGIFRGITNSMHGYWTVVGVTRNALEVMNGRDWKGNFTKDLRRDHMKSGREFQEVLMSRQVNYEEFCRLVEDYGRCVVCTKVENPPRTAGYGHAYSDNDIMWLPMALDTSTSMTVPATRATAALFKSASTKIAAALLAMLSFGMLAIAAAGPALAEKARTFVCNDGGTAVLKDDVVTVTGGFRDGAVLRPGHWWFHDSTEAFIGFLDTDKQEPGVIDCERAK